MKKLLDAIDAPDVVFVFGAGGLFYGLFEIFPPAAFTIVGGLLMLVGWKAAR